MKRALLTMLIFGLLLAACAAGPNELAKTPDEDGEIAGFWQGLWHGVISPVTFVISLFNDNVSVFDVHNNGGWYVFGFLLGASIVFGGGGRGSRRWRN